MAWSARLHVGRAGLIGRHRAGRPRGHAPAGSGAARRRGSGPLVCGRCYEVPGRAARRGLRRCPRGLGGDLLGHPGVDVGAGVAAQLRPRAGVEVVGRRALHPRGPGPLLLPPRRCARRPDGRPRQAARMSAAETTGRRGAGRQRGSRRGRAADPGPPARSAGRPRDDVTLVVVTKFFPASDVRLLHELGVRDVGENRHQEALAKREECADLAAAVALRRPPAEQQGSRRGRLGRRRAVGRPGAAAAGAVAGRARARPDARRARPGEPRSAVRRRRAAQRRARAGGRAARRARSPAPRGCGCAASWRWPRSAGTRTRPSRGWRTWRRRSAPRCPSATWVSAGMSGDLEQAVAAGATHVRVGSAVLGNRPAPR